MTSAVERYGGWKLQIGDSDKTRQWGGAVRGEAVQATGQAAPGGHMVTVSPGRFVEQLKEDLETLGFSYFDVVDGEFDVFTECALREFQVYARMPRVARDASVTLQKSTYYDNLEPVENTKRYEGPASGVLNPETAALIDHWLQNGWRCPVVVIATLDDDAFRVKGQKDPVLRPEKDVRIKKILYENVWRYDQFTAKRKPLVPARYWVYDVSGLYDLPATRADGDAHGAQLERRFRKIGRYYLHSKPPHHHFGGAETRRGPDSWPEMEVTPESLFGQRWEDMPDDVRQSFLVYRTVADQECKGRFDCVNLWDRAIVSFGICHLTFFGLKKNEAERITEFRTGSGVDFLLSLTDPIREKYYSRFGLRAQPRKKRFCLEGENAGKYGNDEKGWSAIEVVGMPAKATAEALALLEHRINFLKSWHWTYRFQMALRCDRDVRVLTAKFFTRQYMDEWRRCPWKDEVADITGPPVRNATLGDVFRSPFLVGFLSRRQVNFPADVASGKKVGPLPKAILERAKVETPSSKWDDDPLTWPPEFQTYLASAITNAVGGISGSKTKDRLSSSWMTYQSWSYDAPGGAVQLSKSTFLSFKYVS